MRSKIWLMAVAGILSACGPFFPDSPSVTRTPSPFEQIPPPANNISPTPLIAEPPGGTPLALTPEVTSQASVAEEDVFLTQQGMIIYRSGGNLCLQRQGFDITTFLLDGASVRQALVSEDGRTIAVVKSLEDKDEVWLVDTDGSNPRLVFDTTRALRPGDSRGAIIAQIEFVPFTRQLLLTTRAADDVGTPNEDLYRIDSNSNSAAVVLAAGDGGGAFSFSPDGKTVALVAIGRQTSANAPAGDYITLLNTNGSNVRQDVFSFDAPLNEDGRHEFVPLTWQLQSKGLWIALPPQKARGDDRLITWYVPANGPAVVIGAIRPADTTRAAFSPDGAWVGFANRLSDTQYQIRLVEPSGRSDFIYYESTNPLRFEEWEVDSRHFTFRDSGQLMRGEIDGAAAPVTNPPVPELACTPPA